ncbi:hypothetical protein BGW41_001962 [Actinomortierella wolfii]|nr:hypothetical protein BGW41_001962 [Actinomortierella wolfii]
MSSRNTAIAVLSFILLLFLFSVSSRLRSTTVDPQRATQSYSHKPTTVDDSEEQREARLESECTQLWRSAIPSQHELALQKADFERELARQIAHLRTLRVSVELNDSPSSIERKLARRLWKQYHPTFPSPSSKSLAIFRSKYFFTLSSTSSATAVAYRHRIEECEAWREKVRLRDQQVGQETFALLGSSSSRSTGKQSHSPASSEGLILPTASSPISLEDDPTAAHALAKFTQSHPGREPIQPNSIMAHTIAALAHKSFTDPSGFTVELDPIKILAGSRRASTFNNDDIHVLVLDSQPDPQVTVMVGNPVDEVVKLRQAGYRPVLLNVANDQVPGGDYYLDSTNDREADLFRRSTIHQCLDQEPRRSQFYPLKENGGVYCPNQAVIRHGPESNYDFMDRFEWISVVSVPRIPKLETRERDDGIGVQFLDGEDDKVRRKILAAMKIGVSMGHDALVLPAHGTDQNQNPPDIIAAVYRSIIGRDFMGGNKRFQTYKKIIMVLDPEYAFRVVNETSAYRMPPPKPSPTPSPLPSTEDESDISTPLPLDENDQSPHLYARADGDDDQEDDSDSYTKASIFHASDEPDEIADEDSHMNEADEETDGETGDDDDDSEGFQVINDASEEDDLTDYNSEPFEASISEDDPLDKLLGEDDQDDLEEINGDLTVPDFENDDERSEFEELLEEQDINPDYAVTDPDDEVEDEDEALIRKLRLEAEDDDSSFTDKDEDAEQENKFSFDDDNVVTKENDDDDDDDDESELTTEPLDGLPEGMVDPSQTSDEEEDPLPLEETVIQVFERMLDERSLLIIKNRGKGGAAAAAAAAAAILPNVTAGSDTPMIPVSAA